MIKDNQTNFHCVIIELQSKRDEIELAIERLKREVENYNTTIGFLQFILDNYGEKRETLNTRI